MYVKKATGYVLPLETRISSSPGIENDIKKYDASVYIKKMLGYVISLQQETVKGFLDTYNPPTVQSSKWKHWVSCIDLKRCIACEQQHGQIYELDEFPETEPPLHPNCRCKIEVMKAAASGSGTKDSENGADWWIKNHGQLPDYR